LDHEPLVAGPPSAGYRLKKLVRRYRGQVLAGTAVLGTAIVGAVVAVDYAITADANATLAKTNERRANEQAAEALREKGRADSKATELDGKVREFDQLAGVVMYDRAIANEKDLYPAWPTKIEAMENWLRDDAGKLLAMQGEIERTVRDLEARALPATAAEQERDRRTHGRFAEFEVLGKRIESLRYAQAIRDGKSQLVVPPLTAEHQALDGEALNTLAWDRVAPKAEERKVYGEEALGLACARLAVSKAVAVDEHQLLDTLAWALLANGRDTEAKAQSAAALAKAPGSDPSTDRARDAGCSSSCRRPSARRTRRSSASADRSCRQPSGTARGRGSRRRCSGCVDCQTRTSRSDRPRDPRGDTTRTRSRLASARETSRGRSHSRTHRAA